MGTPPPKPVVELVERFERDRKVFLSPDYKEEQLRLESSPCRTTRHSHSVIRTFPSMPVIHEESIKVAGATKAPADSSRPAAHSSRLSDSDSGRSAVSRWPLALVIGSLYYPDCPYEFSVLPADILGQVYEQFLGKVIHLTAGHQAKVEEKPEVRKAGGVYYTPTYIVDYIVKNTVGKLLEGGAPAHLTTRRVRITCT